LRGEPDLTLQLRIAQGVDMGRAPAAILSRDKRNDSMFSKRSAIAFS
jgi:hypothetical protein